MRKRTHLFTAFMLICTINPIAASADDAALCYSYSSTDTMKPTSANGYADWSRGPLQGIGVCTSTDQGRIVENYNFNMKITNEDQSYCYCKILFPKISKWVRKTVVSATDDDCPQKCAYSCAKINWDNNNFF